MGGWGFGFVVGPICVVIIKDGPFSKKVNYVFLKTKSCTFRDVDANKFHFSFPQPFIHRFRNDSAVWGLSQFCRAPLSIRKSTSSVVILPALTNLAR